MSMSTAYASAYDVAADEWDPGTWEGASRVWLEAVLSRHLERAGEDSMTAAVRAELASRPWQGVNPYA